MVYIWFIYGLLRNRLWTKGGANMNEIIKEQGSSNFVLNSGEMTNRKYS